jgi:hypothetical protein
MDGVSRCPDEWEKEKQPNRMKENKGRNKEEVEAREMTEGQKERTNPLLQETKVLKRRLRTLFNLNLLLLRPLNQHHLSTPAPKGWVLSRVVPEQDGLRREETLRAQDVRAGPIVLPAGH